MFSALTEHATNSPRKESDEDVHDASKRRVKLNGGSSALRRGIEIHQPLPYVPARWRQRGD